MLVKYNGPLHMNPKNAYELRWVELAEVIEDSKADQNRDPFDRKCAPWVHTLLSFPVGMVEEKFSA